jgi:hypothetical protein
VSWVKFHDQLTQGTKRALSRATRFVYMELALRARPKAGIIDLRTDLDEVAAICDVLGETSIKGRREVAVAIRDLRNGPDPMVEIVATRNADMSGIEKLHLALPSWSLWNATDLSTSRVRKHREVKHLATHETRSTPFLKRDETEVKRCQIREIRGEEIPLSPPQGGGPAAPSETETRTVRVPPRLVRRPW